MVPNFRGRGGLQAAAKWIGENVSKHPIFSKPISLLSDPDIKSGLVESIQKIVDTWKEMNRKEPGFFDEDIKATNQKFTRHFFGRYGRAPTKAETQLYHLVSADVSPGVPPVTDSDIGLRVLDRYMATGEISAYGDKPATVWDNVTDPQTGKSSRVDTGALRDIEGKPKTAKVTKAAGAPALDRIDALVDKHGLDDAMKWLTTKHSIQELSTELGMSEKDLSGNPSLESEGGYGVDAAAGSKIGSYFLNRVGNMSKNTIDMWIGRFWARCTGEPLVRNGRVVDRPMPTTKQGIRVRRLFIEACEQVAKERGMTTAQVNQYLWEFEHELYAKLGAGSKPGLISQGPEAGIRNIDQGSTGHVSFAALPDPELRPGLAGLHDAPEAVQKSYVDAVMRAVQGSKLGRAFGVVVTGTGVRSVPGEFGPVHKLQLDVAAPVSRWTRLIHPEAVRRIEALASGMAEAMGRKSATYGRMVGPYPSEMANAVQLRLGRSITTPEAQRLGRILQSAGLEHSTTQIVPTKDGFYTYHLGKDSSVFRATMKEACRKVFHKSDIEAQYGRHEGGLIEHADYERKMAEAGRSLGDARRDLISRVGRVDKKFKGILRRLESTSDSGGRRDGGGPSRRGGKAPGKRPLVPAQAKGPP
jgi:hypothetical protein